MDAHAPILNVRDLKRRGAVLIAFALSLVVIFGFMGLAIDVGRLYIARNEAQAFSDSAALAAAVMLDGTTFASAETAVTGTYMSVANTNPWKRNHFQTRPFATADYTVKYSATGLDGSFAAAGAADPAISRFVEVVATAHVPMSFSTILLGITGDGTSPARARAVAAQVLKTTFDEGLVPFAPWAHCSTDPAAIAIGFACPATPGGDNLGMTPNEIYTFRWRPNTFQQSFKKDKATDTTGWCQDDGNDAGFAEALRNLYDTADADGREKLDIGHGYWTSPTIANTKEYKLLLQGAMAEPVDLGDTLDASTNREVSALQKLLTDMAASGEHKIYAPVVDPITGKILGYREFELIPNAYAASTSWCAKYIGPAVYGTGTNPVNSDGIYEIRLVR